jgi:hypothetical protein
MFDLKFLSNGISSNVYFNSGCELSDTDGVVIPATLLNGAVNTGNPEIIDNPVDTTVTVGSYAMFDVLAINATSYLWRESSDNGISWLALEDNGIYSGTKTSVLTIQSVPVSYNNNLYQCILYQGNCQAISDHAILTVESPAGIEYPHGVSGNSIIIYPVPFINTTNLLFNVIPNCTVNITITNILGQIVTDVLCSSVSEGSRHIELNTSNWQSGIYFVRLVQRNSNETFECIKKIFKK